VLPRLRILPDIGAMKLADIRRRDVQAIADQMLADGADPSTIRNTFLPLRVIFRRAVEDGDLAVSPYAGLRIPAVRSRRERIATPDEASKLLSSLEKADRPVWATAFYAGLRLGELRALYWPDVDLAKGVIRVERSLDHKGAIVAPKSRAGRRKVPSVAALRDELLELRVERGEPQDGYVFGDGRPFTASTVYDRAGRAWEKANNDREPEQKLIPIGLHEARHTFASILIAAGVNPKAITTYMGHSSIGVTYDLYGHLMPGSEDEARTLVDAYLERANTQARLTQLDGG
jgi:integrase